MTDIRSAARRRAFVAAAAVAAVAAVAAPFAVQAQVAGFSDIPKEHWAADSVSHLATAGIIKSSSAAPFAPVAAAGAKPGYNGDRPVTRYELAVTLYRFVQYIERANAQPKGRLHIKGEPKSGAQAIEALIADGYLPKDTPLATNGGQMVTAKQLSTALGQVIVKSRINTTPISPDSDLNIERPSGGERAS